MEICEKDALAGEPVEMRCRDFGPVGTKIRKAEIICQDKEYVGRAIRVRRLAGGCLRSLELASMTFSGTGAEHAEQYGQSESMAGHGCLLLWQD
jgi:hypothetical protein